jgi:DNA-binding transcriptional regulator GbsR (MarR family)
MNLTPAMQSFVRHWGEMGGRWGVNRSIAQIHALLYMADRPLAADEIAETLAIARSNVSMSLRELQAYQLIELEHVGNDRRDHFKAKQDPWDMVLSIVDERKRREFDPAAQMVRECVRLSRDDGQTPKNVQERLDNLLEMVEQLDELYRQARRLPRSVLRRVARIREALASIT